MSKTKIILIAIGAVTLLASLVLAYFIYGAVTAEGEANDRVNEMTETGRRLVQAPVYPGAQSVKALESNRVAYATWRAEALATVSRGDRLPAQTTPPLFKQEMVQAARRYAAMPGTADGKLVKPDFPFGFKAYIVDGQLPPAADLPRLQREWGDVLEVVTNLVASGVSEITEITVRDPASVAAAAEAERAKQEKLAAAAAAKEKKNVKNAKKAKEKKNAKNAKNGKGAKDAKKKDTASLLLDADVEPPEITYLSVEFMARPAAFTSVLNALAGTERYIVVENFRFVRERDELTEKLGTGADKKVESSSSRGGRWNNRQKNARQALVDKRAAAKGGNAKAGRDASEPASEVKQGFVTDPLTAPLMKARVELSVYDFRTAAAKEAAAKEAAEEAAAAAAAASEEAADDGKKAEEAK